VTRAELDQDEIDTDIGRDRAGVAPEPGRAVADVEGDPLGEPASVPHNSWRHRIRANPAAHQVYRVVIFTVGLLCIAAGLALSVLPGPLTIPPVLLGLWVWSTEFGWAQRLFQRFKTKGQQAWQHARRHPASSTAITLGGVVAVVVFVWALRYFEVVATVRQAIGL
jgi:hypothetical protein